LDRLPIKNMKPIAFDGLAINLLTGLHLFLAADCYVWWAVSRHKRRPVLDVQRKWARELGFRTRYDGEMIVVRRSIWRIRDVTL
jgi:hypothetical protein